ncbi:MAG TPA: hypothetical protein V6D26_18505, partial [Stenomitos sp.]
MAARKSPKPKPNEIASVPTKPTIIALKSQKSIETPPAPESLQQDVEPPASVEPPTSVEPLIPVEPPASVEPLTPVEPSGAQSKPTKLPPPIKRNKAPLPDITQEAEATTTPAEPSLEGDAESVPSNALFQ